MFSPNTFEDGIGTSTVSQVHDGLNRLVTPNGYVIGRTKLLSQGLPVCVTASGDDLLGAAHLSSYDGTQSNRTVTHYDDGIASADVGNPRCVVTSRHNICQGQQGLLHALTVVGGLTRNLDQCPLTMLEANVFSLHPRREVVSVALARTIKAGPTSRTVSTTVGKWRNHEIARLNGRDLVTDFFNDPQRFVTRVFSFCFDRVDAPEVPQVRPADTGTQYLDNDVIRLLDRWLINVL